MLGGEEGGNTLHIPSGEKLAIYDAAMRYAEEHTPLVIVAGKEYGTGSSRDWAAKGTNLLGVKQSLPKALSVFTVLIWLEWGFCRYSLSMVKHDNL